MENSHPPSAEKTMTRYMTGEVDQDISPMRVNRVSLDPMLDDNNGQGLTLHTTHGDLGAIWHEAQESLRAVVLASGSGGGFNGPGRVFYTQFAEDLRQIGISALRVDYRHPADLVPSGMDVLGGIDFLKSKNYGPVVVVGHSFGGAVAIAAGAASPHCCGVISLAGQTQGAYRAGMISPRPLLIIHGERDTRLPVLCAIQIHSWAAHPKRIVIYPNAEHSLLEHRDELEILLKEWILETLENGVTS